MRIGIISDIHAKINSLQKAYGALRKTGVDRIYHAGDIVGYGKEPNRVISFLQKNKIEGVLGNFDEAVAFNLPSCGCFAKTPEAKVKVQRALQEAKKRTSRQNKAWLRTLPDEHRLVINHKKILIVHATIFAIAQYLYEDSEEEIFKDITRSSEADIILCGHTHAPYKKRVGGVYFINPGSISCPRHGAKFPSCMLLSITSSVRCRTITFKN